MLFQKSLSKQIVFFHICETVWYKWTQCKTEAFISLISSYCQSNNRKNLFCFLFLLFCFVCLFSEGKSYMALTWEKHYIFRKLITVLHHITCLGCSKLTLTITFVNCINRHFKMHLSMDCTQLRTQDSSKLTAPSFSPKEKYFVAKLHH